MKGLVKIIGLILGILGLIRLISSHKVDFPAPDGAEITIRFFIIYFELVL